MYLIYLPAYFTKSNKENYLLIPEKDYDKFSKDPISFLNENNISYNSDMIPYWLKELERTGIEKYSSLIDETYYYQNKMKENTNV